MEQIVTDETFSKQLEQPETVEARAGWISARIPSRGQVLEA
jgi:hypothetical protein